jgi:hypothetical protein
MFSQVSGHQGIPAVLIRKLFPEVNKAFGHMLPKHPLTAPTHTPLGVWAGRQLSGCRRAQKMRHCAGVAIKRTSGAVPVVPSRRRGITGTTDQVGKAQSRALHVR